MTLKCSGGSLGHLDVLHDQRSIRVAIRTGRGGHLDPLSRTVQGRNGDAARAHRPAGARTSALAVWGANRPPRRRRAAAGNAWRRHNATADGPGQ